MSNQAHYLRVHPSVVFQLGETLISDEVTAIVELVKNAWDADARWCRVSVDTDAVTTAEGSFFPGQCGVITIEDDGTGMDGEEIERGWLTLSFSSKREAKTVGRFTPRFARTPLGDKGLGRLGTQRLGNVLELWTTKTWIESLGGDKVPPAKQPERLSDITYHVGIDWREFEGKAALDDVEVRFDTNANHARKSGTRVVVSGLHDPSAWSTNAVDNLQKRLSQFIFPFGTVRPFRVYARINGEDLDLIEISDKVRDAANSRFVFSYAGGVLSIKGYYSTGSFRPPESGRQDEFVRLISQDHGKAFFAWLAKDRPLISRLGAEYNRDGRWFITTSISRGSDQLGELSTSNRDIADPGPFEGEIDGFSFAREAVDDLSEEVFAGFDEVVRRQSGVRIFRDGFAIRPYGMDNDDWLGLGQRWTRGSSWYGLRPRNVVGYVAISAATNTQLIEKTDREGFTDTPHARNFLRLMSEVVDTINRNTSTLRRGYNEYQKQIAGETANIAPTAEAVYDRIRETGRGAAELRASVVQTADSIERTRIAVVAIAKRAGDSPGVLDLTKELDTVVASANKLMTDVEKYADRASKLSSTATVLEQDLSVVRDQLEQFAELASLGLTAEAVSHEMRSIAGSLAVRTRDILPQIRRQSVSNADLITYTEHVRSAVSALRKQLSHLAPALRYVREHVDTVDVRSFLNDSVKFHASGLARAGIAYDVDDIGRDFAVRINRGKLTQVLDNLIFNSRYWLVQGPIAGKITEARIRARIDASAILFWDTGFGIDPAIENALFEPFVTNKPKGRGRGLGLFIARQLLSSSGCSIDLLPDRNGYGNRYVFRIDLSGALNGST